MTHDSADNDSAQAMIPSKIAEDVLHPEAGKPLACSSAIRITVNGRETRFHQGFGTMIKASRFPECSPIPKSIHIR